MVEVLRWGRAVYETDADLERERSGLAALGARWTLWEPKAPPPGLSLADVLVVHSGVPLRAPELDMFGGRLVITTTSGFDHIDVAHARRRGLVVARSPLARRDAVVEHALAAMISLGRRLDSLHARAHAGVWARAELPALAPLGLAGKAVAVVGVGVIGAHMASVLEVLGAEVLEVDPHAPPGARRRWELTEALERAAFVTLHCALGPTSRMLLDAARLDLLAPGAVVVNTARGDVLDVEAAVARVADGRLGGLAVDVFPAEPWPRLAELSIPGVWLTPHASGYSDGLGARVADAVIGAVRAWLRGEPVPFEVSGTHPHGLTPIAERAAAP